MTWVPGVTALWLGVLTAISPCPLATNIAAISFIGRKVGRKHQVVASGILYAVGRTLAYVFLGFVITAGILANDEVSRFLQKYLNEVLGPVLIFLGLVLLGWIGSGMSLQLDSSGLQEKAQTGSVAWAIPLGTLFALSFCPVSAGLFFGALIPLALQHESSFLLPVVYGIGTALPVVAFALILAFSTAYVGKVFNRLTQVELWVRHLAGVAFILVGIYFCLTHNFELL